MEVGYAVPIFGIAVAGGEVGQDMSPLFVKMNNITATADVLLTFVPTHLWQGVAMELDVTSGLMPDSQWSDVTEALNLRNHSAGVMQPDVMQYELLLMLHGCSLYSALDFCVEYCKTSYAHKVAFNNCMLLR